MADTLEYHDGLRMLAVRSEQLMSDDPTRVVNWYPVMRDVARSRIEHLPLGQALRYEFGRGFFSYDRRFGGDRRVPVALADGLGTRPALTEEYEIPPPKARVPLRWRHGAWEKLTKREGWVPATPGR